MLTVRLPSDLEKRLDAIAKRTGRTKSLLASDAILRHLEDLEDYYLARSRRPAGRPRVSLEEIEADFTERSARRE